MPFVQDIDAKLTLTRVATAPVLIAEVAKLTGRHLEVAPTLGTEVLMVSVENTGAAEVLAKIAVAATANWLPVEGGYRLVPDNAARGIEAAGERARRLQAITENLKKRQAAGQKDDAAAMAGAFMGAGKIDEFIPMLDLSAIAGLGVGERIVFATNANPAQRPLRGNPMAIVSQWIEDHNKVAKQMAGSMDQVPEEAKAFMSGPIGERFKKMTKVVKTNPTKVIVAVSRGGNAFFGAMGLGVRVEARAYAADGSLLLEESGSLDTDMMETIMKMAAAQKGGEASVTKSTPIEYSADAKALMVATTVQSPMSGGNLSGLKLPASLHEKLFSPDRFDPLELVPGEGLAAWAKARRKPLVGCIPDSAYPGLITNAAPKTIEQVEESLKTGSMRLVPDTTFLVVKPAEPATSRRVRVDRTALAALLHAVEDHQTPTLDELSSYAVQTVAPADNAVSMAFLMKFAPATMGSMAGMVSWDALKVFGSITNAQRQTLASGGQVPFSQVGPAGKQALSSMLYGSSSELTVERAGVSSEPDIFSSAMKMMMGGGGVDVQDEPTEIAPHGLPNNGYLQAVVTTDSIIRPVSPDGEVYYSLGTDELAMFSMISSGPMGQAVGDQMKLPESGRMGTRTLWNLRGYVAQGAYVGSALTDDRTPKNGAAVNLSSLPADMQAKVAAKSEKLKKSPLGMLMTMGAMARPQAKP